MGIFSRRRSVAIAVFTLSSFTAASTFAVSAADLPMPAGCTAANQQVAGDTNIAAPKFPATQLQVRTPFAPTAFASGGRHYLVYELHFQNFSDTAVTMRRIDVVDAEKVQGKNITALQELQLNSLVRPAGGGGQYARQAHIDGNRQISAGQGAIAFFCIGFDNQSAVPHQLRHRLYLDNERLDGPVVDISKKPASLLGRPLLGTDWRPRNGPHVDSHHRMGLWAGEGIAQISRRYAIDWLKVKNGEQSAGDPRKLESYFAYGEKVLSVADGVVVRAADGFPDNIPKTAAGFETALPVTMENLGGNTVVIELANGQFAAYLHLKPGSVGVKLGERVKKGQVIARVGNSGDSRWPHLHFQVTTNPSVLESEGLPFVIDQFRMKIANGEWMTRSNEFPWGDETMIDFGEDKAKEK